MLYVLEKKVHPPVPARLLFLHFLGDQFPDARPCPATEGDWRELIEARRLTLGLPRGDGLTGRIHEIFLLVLQVVAI